MIESWALEKLNPLRNERLVIVHDPQRMIRRGATVVDGWAVQHGFTVIFPSGNLGFRDQFEQVRDNAELKMILVDRSREDRGLPLFYPDLQSRSSSRARLKLTLCDRSVAAHPDVSSQGLTRQAAPPGPDAQCVKRH